MTMQIPEVSIIIPVYNAERYIESAISSVLKQEFQDFELLLIDDGSTDSSGDILDAFAAEDNRIKVFHVENGGPGKARNYGLAMAQGKWIQFMDSDDVIDFDMLSYLRNEAKNYDLIATGVCHEYVRNGKSQEIFLTSQNLSGKKEIGTYIMSMGHSDRDVFLNYLWNKWFVRDLIIKNSLTFNINMRLGEDFEFISKYLSKCASVKVCDKVFYHYYHRENDSLAGKFSIDELDRRKAVYNTFSALMKTLYWNDDVQRIIEENEGRCAIRAMKKINYSSCKLNEKEKTDYILGFLVHPYDGFIRRFILSTTLIQKIKNRKLYLALLRKDTKSIVRHLNKQGN